MRHQKKGRKLHRKRNQRLALMRSLLRSIVRYEKIKTTEAKAKEIRPMIEKLVTRARKDSLANRRYAVGLIGRDLTKKLFLEIAPQYRSRQGGYTRITKIAPRKGDNAKMAIIEFVK